MYHDLKTETGSENIVYTREVAVEDLPADIQEQALGAETLFSVHKSNGAPVALVADRAQAFELARHNDLTPMSVH